MVNMAAQELQLQLQPRQLPQELVLDILSLLPVKSLLRFKCVCKEWYTLLCNPDFITMHLERSRNRQFYLLTAKEYLPAPDNRVLIKEYPCPMYRLIEDPDPSKSYVKHIFGVVREDKLDQPINLGTLKPRVPHIFNWINGRRYLALDVVGSINGLFCLSFNCGTCIVLWNPATRQSYQVPDPQISTKGCGEHSIGFAEHNGVKVIRIVSKFPSSIYFPVSKVRAELYDLKTNTWSEILYPPQVFFCMHQCGTILKGVPYWPMDYDVFASEKSEWIISFSPSRRTFNLIKRPNFDISEAEFTWRLGVMGDSLVTFVQKSDFSIDVWMKMDDLIGDKGCWTKQFTISPVAGIETWVSCWKDGEFFVSDKHEFDFKKEFFLYDPRNNEVKVLPLTWSQEQESAYNVSVFSESLVSPFYIK